MEDIRGSPVVGPSVWNRYDVRTVAGITRYFSGKEPASSGRTQEWQPFRADDHAALRRAQRILTTINEIVDHVRAELLGGCGFTVLHDIVPEETDMETLKQRYCEFGSQLGVLAAQNADGDLLRCVTDQESSPADREPGRARGHRGRSRMSPHTDSADFAALFCVRPARRGGASSLCSAAAIYNEILARRPEYLEPLSRGFHFDMSGKTKIGSGVTERRIPVFSLRGGNLTCVFNRDRIVIGMRKAGLALEGSELAAVDYLDALAKSDEFTLRFTLQAGDVLLLNNRRILHGRDEYDDWPEPNRKRLLLRIWMNLDAPQGLVRAWG